MSRSGRRTWTRPVLKRNTLAPKTKNDSRVLAGRAENTNQLKLHYLGRFRVTSPEPEVITIGGESLVTSMRTELSPIFVANHLLTVLSETVRGQRR
jgi:hypothetical protein